MLSRFLKDWRACFPGWYQSMQIEYLLLQWPTPLHCTTTRNTQFKIISLLKYQDRRLKSPSEVADGLEIFGVN